MGHQLPDNSNRCSLTLSRSVLIPPFSATRESRSTGRYTSRSRRPAGKMPSGEESDSEHHDAPRRDESWASALITCEQLSHRDIWRMRLSKTFRKSLRCVLADCSTHGVPNVERQVDLGESLTARTESLCKCLTLVHVAYADFYLLQQHSGSSGHQISVML